MTKEELIPLAMLLNTAKAWVPAGAFASQSNIDDAFKVLEPYGIRLVPARFPNDNDRYEVIP